MPGDSPDRPQSEYVRAALSPAPHPVDQRVEGAGSSGRSASTRQAAGLASLSEQFDTISDDEETADGATEGSLLEDSILNDTADDDSEEIGDAATLEQPHPLYVQPLRLRTVLEGTHFFLHVIGLI